MWREEDYASALTPASARPSRRSASRAGVDVAFSMLDSVAVHAAWILSFGSGHEHVSMSCVTRSWTELTISQHHQPDALDAGARTPQDALVAPLPVRNVRQGHAVGELRHVREALLQRCDDTQQLGRARVELADRVAGGEELVVVVVHERVAGRLEAADVCVLVRSDGKKEGRRLARLETATALTTRERRCRGQQLRQARARNEVLVVFGRHKIRAAKVARVLWRERVRWWFR